MISNLKSRVRAAGKALNKIRPKYETIVVFLDGVTILPDGREVTKEEFDKLHPPGPDDYTIEVNPEDEN